MIDIEIIKARKAVYGSNFDCIAEYWSSYLDIELTGKEVALMMAHLKKCRIDYIREKLSEGAEPVVAKKLIESLGDSEKDMHNYLWINKNYEEYKAL